ncbi:MAG: glutamine-hydrolyzing GMP synthase [Candidatus Peregrinibacteria bacterium]|nr:glutamine-hydrolyzing GMP synthase [Candidatus Peregrinibacteria bacterium]
MQKGSIVILDFGGQYAHLIARRVRECGAFSAILPPETPAEKLKDAAGIILSGGPQSVYEEGSPQADAKIFELGIPILGICYGHQWTAHALGGTVKPGKIKEYGHTSIDVLGGSLFEGLPKKFTVWMSHGDEVSVVPSGFSVFAKSTTCPIVAMGDERRKFFGTQFHLEVVHTENGQEILKRFVSLCDHAPWSVDDFSKRIREQVKADVGDRKVFMLVSGGVDSTVAFTLLNDVLGTDRVQGLLVDTGLMRKDEVKTIQKTFAERGITNLHVEDASEEFFTNLENVYEPEQKRKIIGDTFLAVQKRVSERMGLRAEDGWMLGQGTIYPDTIETGGTKHADKIKTHHNRVPAIEELIAKGLVIEPLKELYKDEVRKLGEELGLPHDLVWRHPFPGPGLGVRILCAQEPSSTEEGSVPCDVPYAMLPLKSVGVQGDGRTYRHALVLFADFDAEPAKFAPLATTIPNADRRFNRVLLCLTKNERTDFTFASRSITRERADLLREADAIVDEEIRRADLYQSIWQFPVVLLPVGFTDSGQTIVLRPVASQEAMTANAVLLKRAQLQSIVERIQKLPGIDAVLLDLTNKPPATIEWE